MSSRNGGGSDAPGAMMAEEIDDQYEYRASDLDDEDIERRLIDDMEDDDRLQSGAGRRGVDDDVDFVKMSGLTQPDAETAPWPDAEAEPELIEDADPTAPISFFEEGVDDVDATRDPITAHDLPLPNGDELLNTTPVPHSGERLEPSFLRDLKSIVSDFSSARLDEDSGETADSQDDDRAPNHDDGPSPGLVAEENAAPEWTRQLDRNEEQAGGDWERPAYEDLDADMLDWIAQKLESDDESGAGAPQWDMGGHEYSLEQAQQASPVTDTAGDAPIGDEISPGADVLSVSALPDEAPPSRPMPPWAAFRRPLEEDDIPEAAGAADAVAASDDSDAAAASYYDPDVWEKRGREHKREDGTGDAFQRPAYLDDDEYPEQDITAIPLPPTSLRTRELTRAQALMHSLEPAPIPDEGTLVEPEAGATTVDHCATGAPRAEMPAFDDRAAPEQPNIPPMAPVVASRFDAAPDEDDAAGAFTPRRRTHPRRRRWVNALLRFFFIAIIIAALAAGAVSGWYWYQRQAESPETVFRRAESRLNGGEYAAASDAFLRFTESFPQSALKADALFNAAYALQAAPADPKTESENTYRRSLALFDRFIEQYPGHDKTPRAQTMAAVLHYRLGEYETAITRLQSANGRTTDPLTYLPSLRTLARSYARLGEIEEARSAFLRAASLDTNFTPDQDYLELAALYKTYAAQTESEAEREDYVAEAIEMWNYALRVPGLPAPKRRAIKNYIAAEEQLLNEGPAPMSTAQTAPGVQ